MSEYEELVAEIVAEDMELIQEVIKEEIAPLVKFGNPETLIGKPYELWTPQDLQMLSQIYGTGDTVLSRLVFNKQYDKYETQHGEVL
jgi:hypothetical protein